MWVCVRVVELCHGFLWEVFGGVPEFLYHRLEFFYYVGDRLSVLVVILYRDA